MHLFLRYQYRFQDPIRVHTLSFIFFVAFRPSAIRVLVGHVYRQRAEPPTRTGAPPGTSNTSTGLAKLQLRTANMNRALSAMERCEAACSSTTHLNHARPCTVVGRAPRFAPATRSMSGVGRRSYNSATTRVITPSRAGEVASLEKALKPLPEGLLTEVLRPVADDMETMRCNLKNVVGKRHPMLMAAAEQIFGAGGKRLRPAIVFLVSKATQQLQQQG